MPGRGKCVHCKGSGSCPECFGSGKNTHLNTSDVQCRGCIGTGLCPVCGGHVPKNPVTRLLLWIRGDR
jgi:hypothetical protein